MYLFRSGARPEMFKLVGKVKLMKTAYQIANRKYSTKIKRYKLYTAQ